MAVGAVFAAAGLDIFLVPNSIIDGGIVGVSIIASFLTVIPLGVYTFALNIPFLFIGYKQIGKSFVISSLFSTAVFSLFVTLFHAVPSLTHDVLLATVFGGIILGVGVGLILRCGGSLDGTEIIAIILSRKSFLSVGQIVMVMNIVIFTLAAFILGWDRALYSILAYFIAHKAIDVILDGVDEAKAVMIVSDQSEEISEAIMARLGRGVTVWEGQGGFSKEKNRIIFSVVTRLEITKLRAIVHEKDENAFITVHDVADVTGGRYKKRAIH
ncbi:YitT family protein [Oscillospiraceae bacterium CM]|nr:YitT family protein [Oscillospiraceae bacterium CM]